MSDGKRRRVVAWSAAVVAVGAIVILSLDPNALVVPYFVDDARLAMARNDVRAICDASVEFYADKGRWPKNIYELVCPEEPPGTCCNPGTDPWRNDFVIEAAGDRITAICYGADGKPGGRGVDADIWFSRSLPVSD